MHPVLEGRELALRGGLKLVSTGGQFEGYQVLHWPAGAGGEGVLMAGDQPQICMDPKQVTFMYSYPNYIPLNGRQIRQIVDCLDPLPFDRIYGASSPAARGSSRRGARRSSATRPTAIDHPGDRPISGGRFGVL